MSGDIYGYHNGRGWRGAVYYRHLVVEARDIPKHPVRQRSAPTTKNLPIPKGSSVKVEKF